MFLQFQEPKEEPEDDEAMDEDNMESEAPSEAHSEAPSESIDNSKSPFKRPSDAQSIDSFSKGGRERHLSHTSMESEAESSIGKSKFHHQMVLTSPSDVKRCDF